MGQQGKTVRQGEPHGFEQAPDYRRLPRREPPFFSMYRSSDSLLSDDCINCFSRSSKSAGSLGGAGRGTKLLPRLLPERWGRSLPPPPCLKRVFRKRWCVVGKYNNKKRLSEASFSLE